MKKTIGLALCVLLVGCGDEDSPVTPGIEAGADTSTNDTSSDDTSTPPDDTGEADSATEDTAVTTDSATKDSSATDSAMDSTSSDSAMSDSAMTDSAMTDSGTTDSAMEAGETGAMKTQKIWVMRLGDGSAVTTGTSVALFLEPITVTYSGTTASGSVGTSVALPSTGASAVSLAISSSIGGLARSPNGKYVSFAAYKAPAGTAAIVASSSTGASAVKRVGVAVDATGAITSTDLGPEANDSGNSIRSALTTDGVKFWTASEDKGVTYTATAGTTVAIAAGNTRWLFSAGDQLFVTSGSATPGRGALTVGTGFPTTAATLTVVTPAASGSPSPYGAIGLDTDSVAGIDTLYVCDDRAAASGGGVQRWRKGSAGYTLEATLTGDFGARCRGLTAWLDAGNVYLVVTTEETPPRAVLMIDTVAGLASIATSTELAKAAANTEYRGVALAPVP